MTAEEKIAMMKLLWEGGIEPQLHLLETILVREEEIGDGMKQEIIEQVRESILRANDLLLSPTNVGECSAQLVDDWSGSSTIEVDGIHFAPCGFDDQSGFSQEDLENGLQTRIWGVVTKIAQMFGVTPCASKAAQEYLEAQLSEK